LPHEEEVRQAFVSLGFMCEHIGQGTETVAVRDIMRGVKSPFRWMPDLVARKDNRLLWIDAKKCEPHQPNYSLELDAYDAFRKWQDYAGHGCVYVWGDMHYCSLDHIRMGLDSYEIRRGPRSHRGSGTPYVLIPKKYPYKSPLSLAAHIQLRKADR
jgi:hypothetical protein